MPEPRDIGPPRIISREEALSSLGVAIHRWHSAEAEKQEIARHVLRTLENLGLVICRRLDRGRLPRRGV
jgi:hypothetical protein